MKSDSFEWWQEEELWKNMLFSDLMILWNLCLSTKEKSAFHSGKIS